MNYLCLLTTGGTQTTFIFSRTVGTTYHRLKSSFYYYFSDVVDEFILLGMKEARKNREMHSLNIRIAYNSQRIRHSMEEKE